jgi:glycosidase
MNTSQQGKPVIYQLLVRLAGNRKTPQRPFGSRQENGCGTFDDISAHFLHEIKKLGCTHIWLTGILRHASCTSYEDYGIPLSSPHFVKGVAGSPYAVSDYYDVSPDLATSVPDRLRECEDMISRCRDTGLLPIIDFVPNHVAREYRSVGKPQGINDLGEKDDKYRSFSPENNFYYLPDQPLQLPEEIGQLPYVQEAGKTMPEENPARATGNDCFSATPSVNDWYETIKLNYGVDYLNHRVTHFAPVPDTWHKMLDILLFWAGKGAGGFRCDMAEMVPLTFWSWSIKQVREHYPDTLFIAEAYDPASYASLIHEGGFDYLYDKAGLYDTLKAVLRGEQPASSISSVWQQLHELDPYMLRFMENHDEERVAGKAFGASARAGLAATAVSGTLHQGPLMLYFGQELGERAEGAPGYSGEDGKTTIFDYWHVPSFQAWFNNGKCNDERMDAEMKSLRDAYQKLLSLCRNDVFSLGAFYDLMWANSGSGACDTKNLYAFLRYKDETVYLVVVNFHATNTIDSIFHIPEHFREHSGLYPGNAPKVVHLFNGNGHIIADNPAEEMKNGMQIRIDPLTVMILDVS